MNLVRTLYCACWSYSYLYPKISLVTWLCRLQPRSHTVRRISLDQMTAQPFRDSGATPLAHRTFRPLGYCIPVHLAAVGSKLHRPAPPLPWLQIEWRQPNRGRERGGHSAFSVAKEGKRHLDFASHFEDAWNYVNNRVMTVVALEVHMPMSTCSCVPSLTWRWISFISSFGIFLFLFLSLAFYLSSFPFFVMFSSIFSFVLSVYLHLSRSSFSPFQFFLCILTFPFSFAFSTSFQFSFFFQFRSPSFPRFFY